MNINGFNPNIGEIFSAKPAVKPVADQNYTGPSFAQNFKSVAQAANVQVAAGNDAASLLLNNRRGEALEELFSFTGAEEESLNDSLDRIKKLLNGLKK